MKRKILLLVGLVFITQTSWIQQPQQTRTIQVCLYENAPKIYTDENGNAAGFWPTLLNYIAIQEGWEIKWMQGRWEDCLLWLENNEIDILPDTGWTEERSQLYTFSEETVLISWTRLYVPVGSDIRSILDLEGKTIAGLKGSFNLDGPEGIKDLTSQFGVNSIFVEMDSYTQVFEALENGLVDAGITNKDFGNLNEQKYNVSRTPIIFQPARIQFAFTKDSELTPYLVERIDSHMQELKEDDNSIYYQALETYLGEKASGLIKQVIPDWVKNLGIFGGGVLLFLLAVGVVSRVQVKRRTAELKQNQSLLNTIVESTTDAVFVKDIHNKYILYNTGAEKIVGKSPKDVLGQDDHFVFPNNAQEIIQIDHEIIRAGKPITYEETLPNANGQYHTFLTTKGPLYSKNKEILGVFGIARDITERKQAEMDLRESETKYRSLFENSADGIFVLDEQSNVLELNELACEMLGYSRNELRLINVTTLIHEDHFKGKDHTAALKSLMEGNTVHAEYRLRKKDGTYVPTELSTKMLEAGRFLNIVRDITERKQIEDALRASENFRRLIVDIEPECVKLIAPNGNLIEMNPAGLAMIEADSLKQVQGTPMLNIVAPEFRDSFKTLHNQVMKGESGMLEFEIIGLKGTHRWMETHAVPLRNESNQKIEGLLGITRDITERKEAEEQLKNSEERFRALWESTIEAIVIHDRGIILEVNSAALQLFGITREQAIGKSIVEFALPENRDLIREKIESQTMEPYETTIMRADGKRFIIEVSRKESSFLGRVVRIVSIRDITERKRAEEEIKRLKDFDDTLINSMGEGIMVQNAAGEFTFVNPTALELTGYSKEEVIGQHWTKFIPIDQHEIIKQADNRRLNGETSQYEVEFLHKSGKRMSQLVSGSPLFENNQYNGTIAVFLDITERKRAEQDILHYLNQLTALNKGALQLQKLVSPQVLANEIIQSLEIILNYTYSAVLLIDESGNRLIPFALSTQGKGNEFVITDKENLESHNLMIGKGITGWVAQTGESVLLGNVQLDPRYYGLRDNIHSELCVPLKIGEKIIGVINVESEQVDAYSESDKNVLETVAAQVSIAIQNTQLFEQIQKQSAELEQRVKERTAELNQTNLELEHANRAKDEFLATMSHELRTPLNSILGLSESLLEQRRDTLSVHQQQSLKIIETSGQHLLQLINDILDLSKIEAGKFDYYPQLLSVSDLCKSSITFVKSQAHKKGIALTYEPHEPISDFSADPRRLKQILVNLLTNAVKFTPNGGKVNLKVNLQQDAILFSVIDTGIGIALEDLQGLFTPFVQVDSSLNREFEGTGLGLALAQKLTDLHGGSIEVESEVGKGSRFTVKLPYLPEKLEPQDDVSPDPNTQTDIQSKHTLEKKKILLVEDNESNILTIGEYLENHGYEIIIANDGVQAIEKAEQTLPNIILMDIQMPIMDGLEAIHRLRADPQFVSVPIIALTALAMPGDRERCLEAGANHYMSKPVSLKELLKMIASLLQ